MIEPNKRILPTLEAYRKANCCQFKIINKVVAYGKIEEKINLDNRITESRIIDTNRNYNNSTFDIIPSLTIREVLDYKKFTRKNLICDIEGSEVELLKNEIETIYYQVE